MDYSIEKAAKEKAVLPGRIKKFYPDRRYGFIQAKQGDRFIASDGSEWDVHLLMRTLENVGINHPPTAGDEITFQVELDKDVQEGRTPASAVQVINLSKPSARATGASWDDAASEANASSSTSSEQKGFESSEIYPGLHPNEIVGRAFKTVGEILGSEVENIFRNKFGSNWVLEVNKIRKERDKDLRDINPGTNNWDTQAILRTIDAVEKSAGHQGLIFGDPSKRIEALDCIWKLNKLRNRSVHEDKVTGKEALDALDLAARLLKIAGKVAASDTIYANKRAIKKRAEEEGRGLSGWSWGQVAGGVVLVAAIAGAVNWFMSKPTAIDQPTRTTVPAPSVQLSPVEVQTPVIDLATQWDKFD